MVEFAGMNDPQKNRQFMRDWGDGRPTFRFKSEKSKRPKPKLAALPGVGAPRMWRAST